MKIIHVARKPPEGAVVGSILEHGTGALNIDASRISTDENLNGGTYSSGGRASLPGDTRKGAEAGMFQEGGGRMPGQYQQPPGRWPANLILQHLPDCEHVGTHQVASDSPYPASRPSGSEVRGSSGHKGQEGLQEAFTKGETGDTWVCAPGCPVAALDEDSGITSQPEKDRWVTETGGASRFFKQVKR